DALLVSCCDKLHNARAILTDLRTHGPSVFDRFNAGKAGTLWYYQSLAEVFSRRLPHNPVARDLRDTLQQIATACRVSDLCLTISNIAVIVPIKTKGIM